MNRIYYNDNSPQACAWLWELISAKILPEGDIDCRSIVDVTAADISGYTQCHFFAGIGGWAYALQLAEWPITNNVWTASCPCQPFSGFGKRLGEKDKRHLWPELYRLVSECRPTTMFGEQVASEDAFQWLDGVSLDLEELAYAVAAVRLPAVAFGARHVRKRFYFVAHSCRSRLERPEQKRNRKYLQSTSRYVPWQRWSAAPRVLSRIDGLSTKLVRPPFYKSQVVGYGNSIVPQVAAEFIKSFREIYSERPGIPIY